MLLLFAGGQIARGLGALAGVFVPVWSKLKFVASPFSGKCVPELLTGPTCDDGIDTTVNDTCTVGVCQVGGARGPGRIDSH